ncbi:hypothetical protein Pint_06711 [Pistacia integerrima]|uniref:Uncharacterized protein n=1 Tax=Pistacia integerrima TaxID=434235 RepID=A0ACC0Z2W4_9ROSI|nr:hypothetical protein Pint_06711 [Pistacia integerrima]
MVKEINVLIIQQSIPVMSMKSQTLWKLNSCTSLSDFGNGPPFQICYYFNEGLHFTSKLFHF